MSTRKISDAQFEDGVCIDTGDVDLFLEDAVNRFNLLPPTDDKSSWIQQQFVFGYSERRQDWEVGSGGGAFTLREPPWQLAADSGVSNPPQSLRMKGLNAKAGAVNVQVDSTPGIYCRNGYIWQVSFWADAPMVITDFDMWFQVDSDYDTTTFDESSYSNEWKWTINGPGTIITGDYVDDFVVQLEIDSPLNAQQAGTTNVELQRGQIRADAQYAMSSDLWGSDMLPSFGPHQASGVCVSCRDINVPVAAKSRIRMNVFLPDWSTSDTIDAADNRWMTQHYAPWRLQAYNGTLTFLERKI